MHEPQQNRRNEAARAFVESLDELEHLLGHDSPAQSKSRPASWKSPTSQSKSTQSDDDDVFDLNLLEEAAADLDAFFGDTEPQEED